MYFFYIDFYLVITSIYYLVAFRRVWAMAVVGCHRSSLIVIGYHWSSLAVIGSHRF